MARQFNLNALDAIFLKLNENSVRYIVVGGLAVVAHGYGRATYDADIVIQLNEQNILKGLKALAEIAFIPAQPITPQQFCNPQLREQWRNEKGMMVLKMFSNKFPGFALDVFNHEPFNFDQCWSNCLVDEIRPGIEVHFADIPTLIQMKELAGREKDLDDIKNLKRILGES